MLVSILILTLLLAVLQVAVYVHVRNVVTASAQEGARYAANADVDSGLGAARTVRGRRAGDVGADGAAGWPAPPVRRPTPSGLTLVVVRCTGSVPALLASLGNLLPLEVTGRAVKEAA